MKDMQRITAKKHFGQHFLKDEKTAQAIVDLLKPDARYDEALEIGARMGVLTQFLFQRTDFITTIIEIDKEAIAYLQTKFPEHISAILQGDFFANGFQKKVLINRSPSLGIFHIIYRRRFYSSRLTIKKWFR